MTIHAKQQLITRQDVAALWRHGWLRVKHLLNADDLAQIKKSWDELVDDTPQDYSTVYAPPNKDTPYVVPQKDPNARKIMKQFREPRFFNIDVQRIAVDPRVGEMVRTLLGATSVRLFSEAFLEKGPASEGSKETPWHQDSCYEPFDRRSAVNVWIALEDMPTNQGTIEFISGSHRLGGLGRFEFSQNVAVADLLNEEDIRLLRTLRHEQDVDGPRGVPVARHALGAGEGFVWLGLTLHHAQPNATERRRRAYQRMYISGDVRYSGQPDIHTDNLGLSRGATFDIEDRFPLVA